MSTYSLSNSLEWLNGNMHRNYPLVDSMVVKSTTGAYLPSSFLIDLQLIVPFVEGIDSARFFISSVVRNASSIQVTIGYMISDPENSNARQGFDCAVSAAIPLNLQYTGADLDGSHVVKISAITAEVAPVSPSYTYGIPAGYEALRNIRGTLYIGSCADMSNIGAMKFYYENAAIMQTCVYVEDKEAAIQALRLTDTHNTDSVFTNDVTLHLGDGLVADVIDKNNVNITIDPELVISKINEALAGVVGNAIKSINGVKPDALGDFQIVGQDCTLLDKQQSGISISNPCAKPCCDQDGADSEEIIRALTDLTNAKEVLNNYYTDLATKVNSMQARLSALIASRR